MTRRAAFIYADTLSRHSLSKSHPLKPVRLRYTVELLEGYGAFGLAGASLVPPRPATDDEVLTFHAREYLDAVKEFSRGERLGHGPAFNFSDRGDNPIYPGMYEAQALSAGASTLAAELLLEDRADVAFNTAGGLHHAMRDHASGFCVFNDPALAINKLTERGLKILYVDIDAHHGDGVQAAYYHTDQVMTVSIHESGDYLFPGTGHTYEIGQGKGQGYSVNVPLYPFTGDETYLWAFQEVVPPLVAAFRPDVLATQLGVDAHFNDPLTHLCLTVQGHGGVVRRLGELAPGKWLAFGGGGYDLLAVARAWALDYGTMLGQEWPDELPPDFAKRHGVSRLRDAEAPSQRDDAQRQTREYAERSVLEVQRAVFPLVGAG